MKAHYEHLGNEKLKIILGKLLKRKILDKAEEDALEEEENNRKKNSPKRESIVNIVKAKNGKYKQLGNTTMRKLLRTSYAHRDSDL